MSNLYNYPDTPFNADTIEELTGYTVRDIVACYEDYDRAMRENEALLTALKDVDGNCKYCWYQGREPEGCDCECISCERECGCKDCRDSSKWAWKDGVNNVYGRN